MSDRLLDTNHLGLAVRKKSKVLARLKAELARGVRVGTCIPVLCEIELGAEQVADPAKYRKSLQEVLRMVRQWPLSRATAKLYGEIAFDLKRRGRALSQVDLMLAALCRELDLVLVTRDNDFAALPWLKTENWA
jgi:predicted nucleic acid-binding protein